ncbi:hypothetical protein KJ693_00160 [bacterium]|nr:hypothetical protein [bacterium]
MILVETGQISRLMSKAILDTGILIRFLRGQSQAKDLLRKLYLDSITIGVSVITGLELFVGCRADTSDRSDVLGLLSRLNVIDVSIVNLSNQ